MKSKRIGRLHVITDTTLQKTYTAAELARLAIDGGADTIQYRSKSYDVRTMIREAAAVCEVCKRADVLFIVNDRLDVCMAVEADGVHLGREDVPVDIARRILGDAAIIGGTVRNVAHLHEAERLGASYVGLGPIFETHSKNVGMMPLGLALVQEVAALASIPVIAIAGINSANAASVVAAGAHGVAVIGAVCAADDISAAARSLLEAMS